MNLNTFWAPSGWSLAAFAVLRTPGVASISSTHSGPSAPPLPPITCPPIVSFKEILSKQTLSYRQATLFFSFFFHLR